MYRTCLILIAATLCLSISARAQQQPDIPKLFSQLNEASTTDRAAKKILQAASEDPAVLQSVAEKLPEMIDKPEINETWLNAVRLAGKLKVLETVPSLERAFYRGQQGMPANTTFGTVMLLNDDVVAKALSEIGDPSLPAVRTFLKSTYPKMRRRAVLILININSTASHSLLQEHLPEETDPKLKSLIKDWQDRRSGQP